MSIQTILRIETVNNRVIELMQVGEEYRIDSRHVAPNLDIEHDSFIKTLQTYQVQLEHFGLLRFEIEAVKTATSRGTKYAKYALLNRNQILFAITLSRNTEQVTLWKMAMIDALDQLEKQLTQHAHPVAAALKGCCLNHRPTLHKSGNGSCWRGKTASNMPGYRLHSWRQRSREILPIPLPNACPLLSKRPQLKKDSAFDWAKRSTAV